MDIIKQAITDWLRQILVGGIMMIHCGDPIHYSNITESYWQQHFLGFGRLPSP